MTPDYRSAKFAGEVRRVDIEIPEGALDSDNEITSADRLKAALVKE